MTLAESSAVTICRTVIETVRRTITKPLAWIVSPTVSGMMARVVDEGSGGRTVRGTGGQTVVELLAIRNPPSGYQAMQTTSTQAIPCSRCNGRTTQGSHNLMAVFADRRSCGRGRTWVIQPLPVAYGAVSKVCRISPVANW
jgi:hypothetical protein